MIALAWACGDTPRGTLDAAASGPDAGDAASPRDAAPAPDAGEGADASSADAQEPAPDRPEMPMRTVSRYAALGSSSTAGAGASQPDRAYVPMIHARLEAHRAGQGGVALLNRGEGGARIDRVLAVLPDVEAHRPDVVTLLPFTDYVQTTPERFRAGYDEVLRRLGAVGATVFFGDLRIDAALLCGVGSGPGGCYGTQDRDTLAAKNVIVAELARAHPHVVVVPIFDQNAAHPEWNAPDGHPNDLGHQYLADAFFEALGPWLDGP